MSRLDDFCEVVSRMREAQRTYYRLRGETREASVWGPALTEAKNAEREVDRWLRTIKEERCGAQTVLFSE